MRCSKCGSNNPAGKKFCEDCGAPLANLCHKCGAETTAGKRFCGECGAPLDTISPAEKEPSYGDPSGERRHLTVLFCDLVGSTEIAAQLDPEEWRELVASYHRAAAEAITRYGGHVAKYLGDGVMAYFGYPAAHDNDAERAARASLAILDALSKLNEQPRSSKLTARVGIDSGAVVVGSGAEQDADVFGEAPNIAARVQAAAEQGTVLITAATHQLVSGLFVVEERVARPLRGVARPLDLYRVVRPSGMRGRLAAAAAVRGMTPFINREEELRLLINRWERTRDGEGQVVTIVGEAGIGKSRLMQQFREEISADPHTWLECATAAFFQNTPFYAVTDMLQQTFHWHANQNVERRLEALEASLGLAGLKLEEAVPLVAALLELPLDSKYPSLTMSPEQQRKRLLATLVAWTMGFAKAQPLVMATEDLHWADPSTLEFIQLAVEQGATAPLMLLHTARPDFRIQWPLRSHHTQLTLNRLSARHVRAMVGQVAAQKALPEETIGAVIERTSGVPLFVEELTRAVLESSGTSFSSREIPVTLHDSLMARLDRLGPAKEIPQIGAVIGSDFSYELLQAVHPIPEAALQRALLTLSDSDLLYVQGVAPDSTYLFKHALIRDAAYDALLKSRRRELHRLVASTIDEKFPALKEAHPEVLARHWSEAGETEAAIAAWQRAGEQAVEHGAYREAERHYRDALVKLEILPESPSRDGCELKLQLALGGVMAATRSWSGVETAAVYARARTLAERPGASESVSVFWGLWATALTRGELRAALILADQMLEMACGIDRPQALIAAHYAQGFSRLCVGDLTVARQLFLQAIEHCREEDFHSEFEGFGGYDALVWAAVNEWLLGYPDQALRYIADADALARRLGNPFAVAFVAAVAGFTYKFCGDFGRVEAGAKEQERLGTEFGFPLFCASGKAARSQARIGLGEPSGAVELMRAGLAEMDAIRFYLNLGYNLCALAEAQAATGAVDDALVTIEQSLAASPEQLCFKPFSLLLRGELRLGRTAAGVARFEAAEQDFREAIELARSMNAKSLELRATMSLARLLSKQGRRDEARTMLAEIYNWFTEGFDTADLKDAKALLDELTT
jgi:class 3 adenylate cyclase/tetratricopeptide (TPR) repeat protein